MGTKFHMLLSAMLAMSLLLGGCGGGGGGGGGDDGTPTTAGWFIKAAPDGGSVTSLLIDTSARASENIYASGWGVFFSNNSGTTWTAKNSGLPEGHVQAMGGYFGGAPDVLMAGVHAINSSAIGLYYSSNNATTWALRNGTINKITLTAGQKYQFKVIRLWDTGTAYLVVNNLTDTTKCAIYKTDDAGDTSWVATTNTIVPPTTMTLIDELIITGPTDATLLMLNQNGLYRSTDSGDSWTLQNSTVRGKSLAYSAASTHLFLGRSDTGNEGLWRSDDNGVTWGAAAIALIGQIPSWLALSTDGTKIYAGVNGTAGLVYSADANSRATFTTVNTGLSEYGLNVNSLAVDFANDIVYRGSPIAGVLFKNTGTTTFATKNGDLDNTVFNSMVIHPGDASQLAVGTDSGFYIGSGSGQTWTRYIVSSKNWQNISIDSLDFNTFYVGAQTGTSTGAVYSYNKGSNIWTSLYASFDGKVTNVVALANGDVYAGTTGGVWKSTPAWAELGNLANEVTALAIEDTSNLYAGTSALGIYKWASGSSSWIQQSTGVPVSKVLSLALSTGSSKFLFAGFETGIHYYDPIGAKWWTPTNNGLTSSGKYVSAIVIANPTNTNVNLFQLYIATNDGVWYTSDTGANWTKRATNLTESTMRIIGMFATNPNFLYVGTARGNIFQTSAGGQ